MDLIAQIEQYIPYNEQEQKDKELILHALKTQENIYTRDNSLCHITSSAWVINEKKTKVLMAYHKIYDSWAWLGGHNDGNENCLEVAIQEVKEESGLTKVEAISNDIFSLEVLCVNGHEKKGKYVSSHLHLNVTYLLVANETQILKNNPDENIDVAWFDFKDALEMSNEPWFISRIYQKCNEKAFV
ncbi:NUDIX hydrolase [Floccifex sp.]|uniref:NUDIX hydrolase n=1 Tax=Floccifex sp. TaxID=2815810 RepID=UPI003F0E557E